jgi:hypothetical protein
MSENTILCKCLVCLKENANGVLVSIRTYNRHRKNQQEFLDVEETNISYQEQNVEDLHQQEDVYQQENIYQQKEDSDNSDTDDIDSFDFNEEENEYYSDYNIERYDDNMDDNDDDDDDDGTDNENTMQIDNNFDTTTNKKIIEGLKLLHLKSLYNFTESAYNDIIKVFTTDNISLYKVKKYLKEITGLVPVFYDMCENSCICYTEKYEYYQSCPICDSARLDTKGKAKKVMPYLSIKDRLKIQFSDKTRAKELLYRHEFITNKEDNDLDDIFDGKIYKELVNKNLFNDERDVAFTASCDGYQIFKQKTDDCWLFLMINNNLNPLLRVKKENLLVPFLIPGPNQPKDFNSFLRPFIDEMKELERMNFFILSLFIMQNKTTIIFFYFRRSNML